MSGNRLSRRRFLSKSLGSALVLSALPTPAIRAVSTSPNERIGVAVIGLNGRGGGHVKALGRLSEKARIAGLCDVDERARKRRLQEISKENRDPVQQAADFRRFLDDKSVDAVVIATPNHWHVPIALRAIAAGKDCYVEKPLSHTFQEGRLLVEAAEKSGRIIQHGTQTRSSPVYEEAVKVLASGIIGEVRMAKAWNLQYLKPIEAKPDGQAPEGVDYDLWLGPAPRRPFNSNRFHKSWFQFRDYGNGDIGDDAPHEIDMARLFLGVYSHPSRITAHSSRTQLGGEREFPDTRNVSFDYPDGKVLAYEQRSWTPYGEHGFDNGNAIYGTEGRMIFSRRGYFQVYLGRRDEEGPGMKKATARGEAHLDDFLASVRNRKPTRASALEGHLTCGIVHLGLIASQLGRVLEFDSQKERFKKDTEADALLTKTYRKPWGLPG